MQKGLAATGALLIILLFSQCNKDDSDKVFNARFYTTKANEKLFLYVDGAYKGELPYFSNVPACDAIYGDGTRPLTAQLPSGEYKIMGKNKQGEVISYGTIQISRNRMSTSGNTGGLSLNDNEDCLAVGVF